MREFFKVICETTGIEIGTRNISNHSGRKTAVQLLKELGYSDSVVMSITRHKSQKGLAAYERPKSVMQNEGLSGFFNALKQVSKGEIYIYLLSFDFEYFANVVFFFMKPRVTIMTMKPPIITMAMMPPVTMMAMKPPMTIIIPKAAVKLLQ